MITRIKYLAKGHRSKVFIGFYKNKKVCIKVQKERDVKDSVKREGRWLKILNKFSIGPKLLFYGESLIIYEYVSGDLILDYFRKSSKKKIMFVISEVLKKCRKMDSLGIVKEEMHKPVKHIFISDEVKMIDFERCHYSSKVKNVTQFCQFLTSGEVVKIFSEKGIKINTNGLRSYLKESQRVVSVSEILKFFS